MIEGVVKDEQIEELKGCQIIESSARIIFKMKNDQNWIIKEGINGPSPSNQKEWDIWNEISKSGMACLFAECRAISKNSRYLIMERLDPIDQSKRVSIPDLPSWLTDRKRENLGESKAGTIKVLDYGQVRDFVDRISAPLTPWPSESDIEAMRQIQSKI